MKVSKLKSIAAQYASSTSMTIFGATAPLHAGSSLTTIALPRPCGVTPMVSDQFSAYDLFRPLPNNGEGIRKFTKFTIDGHHLSSAQQP